jgi:hypothetical protein
MFCGASGFGGFGRLRGDMRVSYCQIRVYIKNGNRQKIVSFSAFSAFSNFLQEIVIFEQKFRVYLFAHMVAERVKRG